MMQHLNSGRFKANIACAILILVSVSTLTVQFGMRSSTESYQYHLISTKINEYLFSPEPPNHIGRKRVERVDPELDKL